MTEKVNMLARVWSCATTKTKSIWLGSEDSSIHGFQAIRLIVNNTASSQNITCVMPQGCKTGPLLFICCVLLTCPRL